MQFKHKITPRENAANKMADDLERHKALSMGDNEQELTHPTDEAIVEEFLSAELTLKSMNIDDTVQSSLYIKGRTAEDWMRNTLSRHRASILEEMRSYGYGDVIDKFERERARNEAELTKASDLLARLKSKEI